MPGRGHGSWLKKTALAVFFALGASGSLAQTTTLSPDQGRQVARQALSQGNTALADQIATALIARDANDAEAWLIRALAAQRRGDLTAAADAAAQAWRKGQFDALKFDAAYLSARIAGARQRWEASKFWLRRADQVAGSDQARALVENAYRTAQQASPWSVRLSFSLRPSDNVNGGTDPDASITYPGGAFPVSGEPAVAGIEATGSAQIVYRLSESSKSKTELTTDIFARKVRLNDGELERINERLREESQLSPNAFDYFQLSFGLRHLQLAFPDLGPTSLQAQAGASYYRDEVYSVFATLAATQEVRLSERQAITFGGKIKRTDRKDSPLQSETAFTLSTGIRGRLANNDSYSFQVSLTDHNSDSGAVEGTEVKTQLRYALAKPIRSAQVDLGLDIGYRVYPDFLAGRRENWTIGATVGATFPEASFYGFVPRVELGYNRTESNLAIYDSSGFDLGFSMVSRF